MKQMRPLLFRKQFPPSPNRSVWTLPIEGTAFIEQTCAGGSVCSKVCKFLTATKIVCPTNHSDVSHVFSNNPNNAFPSLLASTVGSNKACYKYRDKKNSNMVPTISAT